jgi:Fur family peroxide stress response transcriptional regulator
MVQLLNIRETLVKHGLKVTPQRLAVFEAFTVLRNHPGADGIIDYVRKNYPNLAVGTVYKTLETFIEKGMIAKVKTYGDVMRYEPVMTKHHHLYTNDCSIIEDYYDDELNRMLDDYFSRKEIPGFQVEDVKIHIIGKFSNNSQKTR